MSRFSSHPPLKELLVCCGDRCCIGEAAGSGTRKSDTTGINIQPGGCVVVLVDGGGEADGRGGRVGGDVWGWDEVPGISVRDVWGLLVTRSCSHPPLKVLVCCGNAGFGVVLVEFL